MRFTDTQRRPGHPMISKVTTRPAPIKGINSYDSIAGMEEGYAFLLRNLFAQPYGCQVRRGYVRHCEGLDGKVETLASHNTTSPKLYAFADGGPVNLTTLYDVTTPNAAPVSKETLLTNARWQTINFPNVAGVHMIAVNGADDLLWFKPDNTIVSVTTGDGTLDTIKNVDPKLLIQVYSHQKRLWFVEKDSTRAWYMPPDQITGEATEFNPGINWTRGGTLVQIITWTIDDGNGADDHLAFISSEGEVSIYQGIDPAAPETWGLQGVYFAGAPVSGNRVACRYGGDIIIITQFGLVQMSNLLKSTKVNPTEGDWSQKVQYLISGVVSEHGTQFGWQPFVFPGANMFIVNVPNTDSNRFQFVMNDITKAWSEFLGYNANCWELHDQLPFFGDLGAVYRAWEQWTDDAIVSNDGKVTPGALIASQAQTSFSYFGALGQQKHFKMVRPTILCRGKFQLSLSANMDFVFDTPNAPVTFQITKAGVWDEDLWDTAVWAGGLLTNKVWTAVTGIGTAASLRILLLTDSETYWATADWLYEVGGVM